MPNFNNNAQFNIGNNTASESFDAPFEGAGLYWVVRGGMSSTRKFAGRSQRTFFQRLCSIREMSEWTGEVQNEREAREAGKVSATVNDGVTFGATITVKGTDVPTLAALQGRHLHNLTTGTINMNAGIRYGETYSDAGDLIVVDYTEGGAEGNVMGGRVVANVDVKFETAPGVSDPNTDVTVTLQTKTNIYHFSNGIVPVPFLFFDDGDVTNTAAPDGTLPSFKIKDANEAYGGSTVPTEDHMLQIVDPNQSGIGRYIIGYREGGVRETTAGINPTNATITPSSVPADGTSIYGIAAMVTGFPDGVEGENYSAGIVRQWGSGTFVANKDTTDSPTTTAADWDEVDMPAIPYWGTAVGGSSFLTATHPAHPGFSWRLYNWFG